MVRAVGRNRFVRIRVGRGSEECTRGATHSLGVSTRDGIAGTSHFRNLDDGDAATCNRLLSRHDGNDVWLRWRRRQRLSRTVGHYDLHFSCCGEECICPAAGVLRTCSWRWCAARRKEQSNTRGSGTFPVGTIQVGRVVGRSDARSLKRRVFSIFRTLLRASARQKKFDSDGIRTRTQLDSTETTGTAPCTCIAHKVPLAHPSYRRFT